MGDDFVKAILDFLKVGRMLREVNSTCITLALKCFSPTSLGDYQPIAWYRVVYKCITKIINSRLRKIILEVVSLNQSTFVVGRHIQDNILLS